MATRHFEKKRVHLSYNVDQKYDHYSEKWRANKQLYRLIELDKELKNMEKNFTPLSMWAQVRESSIEIILEDPIGLESPLDQALRDLLKAQGLPSFVYAGSDYTLCDRALEVYQKRTKRRFPTMFIGKEIVDIE